MAHVEKLVVTGLAGKNKKIKIDFNRNINIIFGKNGSGKTSLLRLIKGIFDFDDNHLLKVPFERASLEMYSQTFDDTFKYHVEKKHKHNKERNDVKENEQSLSISDYEKIKEEKNEIIWDIPEKQNKINVSAWEHSFLPTYRLYHYEFVDTPHFFSTKERELENEEELNRLFSDSLNVLWRMYEYDISEKVRNAQQKGLSNILSEIISPKSKSNYEIYDDITEDEVYERVYSFLERRDEEELIEDKDKFINRYKSDDNLKSVVSDIVNVEKEIEKSVRIKNKFVELVKDLFSGHKEVIFTNKGIEVKTEEGRTIGLGSLSSGEKHLLRIFIPSLLTKMSSILIDEPEISMHIDWQRKLLESLNFLNPEAQYIVATHSPEIMAKYSEDKIFEL